jgi:hypothetical protein
VPNAIQALREWIKRHQIGTAVGAAFALVTGYGALSGGLHQLYADAKSAMGWYDQKREPRTPNYNLQLLDVEAERVNLPANVAPPGVHQAIALSAVVRNFGDPLYFMVADGTADLGGRSQVSIPGAKQGLPMGKGTAVTTKVSVVPVPAGEQELSGRIEWVLKYGADSKHLDHLVPVKGEIGWEPVAGKWRLTFLPDGDSAVPIGMNTDVGAAPQLLSQ